MFLAGFAIMNLFFSHQGGVAVPKAERVELLILLYCGEVGKNQDVTWAEVVGFFVHRQIRILFPLLPSMNQIGTICFFFQDSRLALAV